MARNTKGLTVYLILSFGLAWGGITAVVASGGSVVNPILQLPVAFAPAVAALVVRAWVTREGFANARQRLRLRAAGRYYLYAWFGPVLVLAATVALAAAVGDVRLDPAALPEKVLGADVPWAALAPLALLAPVLAMPVFWGEEFGWRGYLQQRVGRSPLAAALVTGLIWAAWHAPLVLTDYARSDAPGLTMATWAVQITAQAVILAWLFLASGSIWVPSLAHAGNNLVIGTFSEPLLEAFAPWQVNLLQAAPLLAVCAWIVLTGRLSARRVRQ
ncbi:CPBP family intramembrane glutamic endopeptidase [Glycomyces sp. NPDC047369]